MNDKPEHTAETDAKRSGVIAVQCYRIVCQECLNEYEDWNGWSIWLHPADAADSAIDSEWTVRPDLVLCGNCGHRKVCMDEDNKCARRDLTEADDGWLYCPEHIEQGMDDVPVPPPGETQCDEGPRRPDGPE
jgi:hypothetical protein